MEDVDKIRYLVNALEKSFAYLKYPVFYNPANLLFA